MVRRSTPGFVTGLFLFFAALIATTRATAGDFVSIQKCVDASACDVPSIQMVPDALDGVIGAINPATCTNTRPGWLGARFAPGGYNEWPISGVALVPGQSTTQYDGNGVIVPDSAGGAFAFWRNAFDAGVLRGRHVTPAGVADWGASETGETVINTKVVSLLDAAPDGSGGSIVAWLDIRPAAGNDVPGYFVHRLDGSGAPLWSLFGVRFAPFGTLFDWFRVVPDGSGGAWLVGRPEGATALEDYYVNRVAHDGSLPFGIYGPPAGAERSSRARSAAFGSTPAPQPCAVPDGGGGLIMVGSEHDVDPGGDLFALRLAPEGTAVWGAFAVVIDATSGTITHLDCAPDTAGGVLVTWSDGSDVRAERVDAFGQKRWGPAGVLISEPQNVDTEPSIAGVDASGALVAWISEQGGDREVFYRQVAGDGIPWDGGISLTPGEAVPWSPRAHAVNGIGFVMWIDGRDGVVSPGIWDSYDLYAARFPLAVDVHVPVVTGEGELQLAGFLPNPARGMAGVSFTLPRAAHARLDLLDLSGRRVASRSVDAGAGRNHVTLQETIGLPPGAYWIRLEAAGRTVRKIGVLLR